MTDAVSAGAELQAMPGLPAMSGPDIDQVRALESRALECEQTPATTHHLIHAGMYARSLVIPAGSLLTGALIKRATILIVSGDVSVAIGGGRFIRLVGYQVLPASAQRKQAFVAHSDTHMTMIFPTSAMDVAQAEDEFTDEVDQLFSRNGENVVRVTGE